MDILYSYHAVYQMIERRIEKVWIEETIKFPDEIKRNYNKYYVRKKINGKTLKVIYVKERYIKVITLFWVGK